MYLHAKKYVEKVNWKMVDHENNVGYDSPEVVYPLFNQIVELAEMQDVATDIYGAEVSVTCAYWRKANQIHKWFVDNVQNGEDDCDLYYVSQDKLKQLLNTCKEALATKNPSLLPPQEGFFFGSYDIDQYYWGDIKNTIKQLERVSNLPDFERLSFSYQSSW